jgi:hypothetical protein
MKKIAPIFMLLGASCLGFAQNKGHTFTGEIMDKQCAQMHSHENMMQPEHAKNARECALNCVRDGGQFALFDSAGNKVYAIDDPKKVREYAGQRVQITGTYDQDADVLRIKSIAAAH